MTRRRMRSTTRANLTLIVVVGLFLACVVIASNMGLTNHG